MPNNLSFQPYQLPQNTTIPGMFGQDYVNQLQSTLGSEEQNQANNLLGVQQGAGLIPQGGSNTQLLSQVLGSPQQQITGQILPGELQASAIGQGQQYQTQMQNIQFQQQLQAMQQQYQEQEALMILAKQLYPQGYKQSFGQQLGSSLAGHLGDLTDIGATAGLNALL